MLPKLAVGDCVISVTALEGILGEQSTFLCLCSGYAKSQEWTGDWIVCHTASLVLAILSLVSGYLLPIQKPALWIYFLDVTLGFIWGVAVDSSQRREKASPWVMETYCERSIYTLSAQYGIALWWLKQVQIFSLYSISRGKINYIFHKNYLGGFFS